MSRHLTLREACNKLGLVEELSINNDIDNNVEDANEFIAVEDDKEIAIAVDDGDIKVVEER